MFSSPKPLNILVVEDNLNDFILFNAFLKLTDLAVNEVLHATKLLEAFDILQNKNPDIIFLDLTLPDSEGIESFTLLHKLAYQRSIIVLSGIADTKLALSTIVLGAQDYLVKGSFDEILLAKSIQYSIERKKNMQNVVENYERYNSVIKATNDTVWDWDFRTNEVNWNNGINNVFGFSVPEFVTSGEWHFNNVHPDDAGRFVKNIQKCIKSGNEQWEEEYRYSCESGLYKFVHDRGFILRDDNKKPYRMVGVMMDITERKKKQEEVDRSQIERQKLITKIAIQTQDRERGELGRELHDNVNQILATANIYVDLAIRREEVRKELLYKSQDCILKAIKEIRLLSKTLVPDSFRYIGLKTALLEIIQTLNKHTSLSIKLRVHGKDIKKMDGEKKLTIYRIIQEQFNNILKHSKATQAEIEIRCVDNLLYILVKDNGISVNTRKRSKGIGIHNIRSRVEINGGKVQIISSPGNGYALKIEMPFSDLPVPSTLNNTLNRNLVAPDLLIG